MRPFWRAFWASNLSSLLMGIIFLFLFSITLALVLGRALAPLESVMGESTPFKVEEHSILHITLNENISELAYGQFNPVGFQMNQTVGLNELKYGLEAAAEDKKIEGILLNIHGLQLGAASCEEMRNSILDFKESGKFVYAYDEVYSQKAYYLSSVADSVFLYPAGMLEFKGLGADVMFYKNMIDKIGVDMQVIRGSNNKFKSAVEPFISDTMSSANRLQLETLLGSVWNHMLKNVSSERNISVERLNEIADSLYVRNPQDALQYGLVDELMYEDQLMDLLKEKTNQDEEPLLVNFTQYAVKAYDKKMSKQKMKDNNIAVVFAQGEIQEGESDPTIITSEEIASAIRDARTNDDIKAIVLRVNSPGGSALASDVIWREMILAKEAKPVVVSMGDVAASGGYYISCAADRIFAQSNTITGSIGVFAVIPNFEPVLNEHMGINIERVETNEHAQYSVYKALTDKEKKIVQEGVDEIYNDFITKVADGRGITTEQVDSIGQGRVWTGDDALTIGLIDEIGGLQNAIAYAGEKANISENDMVIESLPKRDDKMLKLLRNMKYSEGNSHASLVLRLQNLMSKINKMEDQNIYQARIPFSIEIE